MRVCPSRAGVISPRPRSSGWCAGDVELLGELPRCCRFSPCRRSRRSLDMTLSGMVISLRCLSSRVAGPWRAGPGRPRSRWGDRAARSPTGRWLPAPPGSPRCACQGRAADRPPPPRRRCPRRLVHRGSHRARPPSSLWCGCRARAPAAGWPALAMGVSWKCTAGRPAGTSCSTASSMGTTVPGVPDAYGVAKEIS